MNNGGERDLDGLATLQEPPVDAEDNIQMFVSITKQHLVEGVLKESKDSDVIARLVGFRLCRSFQVVERTQVLQAEQLDHTISNAHGSVDPPRRRRRCCQEVLKRRPIHSCGVDAPSVIEAGTLQQLGRSAVQRHFGFAGGVFHEA